MNKMYRTSLLGIIALVSMSAMKESSSSYYTKTDAAKKADGYVRSLFDWEKQPYPTRESISVFLVDLKASDLFKTFDDAADRRAQPDFCDINSSTFAKTVVELCESFINNEADKSVESLIPTFLGKYASFFTYNNKRNLGPARVFIRHLIADQIKRLSSDPFNKINTKAFSVFIGSGLQDRIKKQLIELMDRTCGTGEMCDGQKNLLLFDCGHVFHEDCYNDLRARSSRPTCPQCRAVLVATEITKPGKVTFAHPQSKPAPRPTPSAPAYQAPQYTPPVVIDPRNVVLGRTIVVTGTEYDREKALGWLLAFGYDAKKS